MKPFVEFLNHGLMPFAGRGDEIDEICRFARQTIDAPELRLFLITGEAGVGKSRLMGEIIPRLEAEELLPLHVRLYPDTTVSIVSTLAEVINRTSSIRSLLRQQVEPNTPSVVSTLRRLSGLRVLLILVEDLHLLSGNALREFGSLCSGLFNDPISIIGVSRPFGPDVRGAIDPYLVEERTLTGLSEGEITGLWEEMLETNVPPELLAGLHGATGGNPLTIRSALRGAFRKGVIGTDGTVVNDKSGAITTLFKQGATRFGEGLAVHLTESEREALETVATLGEVFSIEAAKLMLGERSEGLLEQLLFKGMLAEGNEVATPLGRERTSSPLLFFTHTLVHRQALESSLRPVTNLLQVIAQRVPLYSRVPLDLVEEQGDAEKIDADLLVQLFEAVRTIGAYADSSTEWERAEELQALNENLLRRHGEVLSEPDREYRRVWLHLERTIVMRRQPEVLLALSQEGVTLTEDWLDRWKNDGGSPRWLNLRLNALHHASLLHDDADTLRGYLADAREILKLDPQLRREKPGIGLLRFIALRAVGESDWELVRSVEREIDLDPEILKEGPWGYSHLLLLVALAYDTPEEFQKSEELVRRIEKPIYWRQVRALYPLLRWLFDAGYVDRYRAQIWPGNELYRAHGALPYVVYNSGLAWMLDYLQGLEPIDVERQLAGLDYENISGGEECRLSHLDWLVRSALMRGEEELARRVAEEIPLVALPSAIIMERKQEGAFDHYGTPEVDEKLRQVSDAIADGSVGKKEVHLLGEIFDRSILRLTDPIILLAALSLRERDDLLSGDGSLTLRAAESVRHLLAWYLDPSRRLVVPARHLLDRAASLLEEEEQKRWRAAVRRGEEDQKEIEREADDEASNRTRIRVIGAIAVTPPGGTEREMRGERVSACIGALVANSLLSRPLEMVDFARLATGEEDPAHARKILKVALFRTREAIGAASVLQSDREHGPTLDRRLISVDLIELVESIALATTELGRNGLARATRGASRAIDLFGEDVILPGLYDRVFEALRDEQEARLRGLIIELAERLMEEGDLHSAELLLRKGLGVMPEDEEIAELLQEALRSQGMLTDAELVALSDDEYE